MYYYLAICFPITIYILVNYINKNFQKIDDKNIERLQKLYTKIEKLEEELRISEGRYYKLKEKIKKFTPINSSGY